MNEKDIFKALGGVDPKFISESAPSESNAKAKRKGAPWIRLVAACVALFAVTAVFVMSALMLNRGNDDLPDVLGGETEQTEEATELPERLEKYQGSEYFEIIKGLDAYFERQELSSSNGGGHIAGTTTSQNVQVTDNQTPGVEEADLIKRTDSHIFYMDKGTIRAFSINGENSEEVDSYTVNTKGGHHMSEMFLSADGKTITVVSSTHIHENGDYGISCTEIFSFDVSDPDNIREKASVRFKGSYNSARVSDGKLLVFLRTTLRRERIDFERHETFLPLMDVGNGFEVLSNCDFVCNDWISTMRYQVVLTFNEEDLSMGKNLALLSYDGDPYVSENKMFFNGLAKPIKTDTGSENTFCRRILGVDYTGDSFKVLGFAEVFGTIKDQWSMDEHDGVLRVVTDTGTNANLYCISLESFDVIASVEGFAPEGENVQSVRFDGTAAYVCTAVSTKVQVLDPVFFFDLSDLNNITYKDTGTIEGMSTSLIHYGDGYLIGIGNGVYNGNDSREVLKIEVYKENGDVVVPICKYELMPVMFSGEYKAYYVDRKNQILGLGIQESELTEETEILTQSYILLKFDAQNEQIVEIFKVELKGSPTNMRGVYIDGYMYMFGEGVFKVEAVDIDNVNAEQE